MRSQKEDGEQQRRPQPDHTLEADQVSQDKLGLRSVSLVLDAGPVLFSACWCWGGRGNEVAWVGGVAVEGWGGPILLLLTEQAPHPSPALTKPRMGVAWKALEWGHLRWGRVVRADLGTMGQVFPSPLLPLVLCLANRQEAGGRKGRKPVASAY